MPKCKNDIFMSKVGVNKLAKQMEVDFDIQNNLPDCRKVNTGKYVSTESESPVFNRFRVPQNQFECMRTGCVNSGTLFNQGKKTTYRIPYDATQYSAGVITFYALLPVGATTAIVRISSESNFTNAYGYTVDLTKMAKGKDGFVAVVVDLSETPTSNVGTGWKPVKNGAYIQIEITQPLEADMSGVAISSIAVFDEMEDFAASNHVKLACLTTIDGAFALDAAEATCFGTGGYDIANFTGIDITITGRAITPNYMKLNPFASRGNATVGWESETIETTVEEMGEYGSVVLSDMNQDECGFFSAMLADNCNVFDSSLERLSIPSKIDVDEKHYQLIDNGDGSTTVLFNKELVGSPVLISYPKNADVEEWVMSEDTPGEVRTRLSYVHEYSDGTKFRWVFNNVLVTSFPIGITEDETELSFTVRVQKDSEGVLGHYYRILS